MATRYEFRPITATSRASQNGYETVISIHRTTDEPMALQYLRFSSSRVLLPEDISGAELVERDGDLHRLRLTEPLRPGQTREIYLRNPRDLLRKVTDWPYGVYGETAEGGRLALTMEPPAVNWNMATPPAAIPDAVRTVIPQPTRLHLGETHFPAPKFLVWANDEHKLPKEAWETLLQEVAGVATAAPGPEVWPVTIHRPLEGSGAGYRLDVSAQGANLVATETAGVHAGLATLVQWLAGKTVLPVSIEDAPRFAYRGLHLDVVRHFMTRDYVEKTVRLAALYKLNHLHWHLSDDEGWRLESAAFPELTERVAVRGPDHIMPPQMGTGAEEHGGYYSAEDVRAVVELAHELGVEVIPEIDVPGHARALVRALPELVEPADTSSYRSVQHYSDNVLNPGLPRTLEVLKTLLDEIVALFPSEMIHLGSDEVPEGVWEHSPAAQRKAQQLGLTSVRDLHGWLMAELEQHLASHGRRAAGWEEIVQNQAVSNRTIIYSWQGVEAGKAAAQAGHDVVLTPGQCCYLDLSYNGKPDEPGYYWAGEIDLATAYGFEPEAGWDADTPGQIMGLQACLWSELLAEPWQADYMLLPRLPAIAERAWSDRTTQDFADFTARLATHQALWQRGGWHYRAEALGW